MWVFRGRHIVAFWWTIPFHQVSDALLTWCDDCDTLNNPSRVSMAIGPIIGLEHPDVIQTLSNQVRLFSVCASAVAMSRLDHAAMTRIFPLPGHPDPEADPLYLGVIEVREKNVGT